MRNSLWALLVFIIVGLTACGGGSSTSTVVPPALTAIKNAGYGDQTIAAGTNNAKIGSAVFSAGPTEGVTVNNIALSTADAVSITNLTLKDDSTGLTLGTIIPTPSANNSFSVNLNVPASSTKTIDVYANVLSGTSGTIQMVVTIATAGTGDTTGITASVQNVVPLQTITVDTGTLTVTHGDGDPASANILANSRNVPVGQFKFSAKNLAYMVQNLTVLVPQNATSSVESVTIWYKDVNGTERTATEGFTTSASPSFAQASFVGLQFYVPRNDSSILGVSVNTVSTAVGGVSGTAVYVSLDAGATPGTFKAIDQNGRETMIFNGGTSIAATGTFYVRKSIPTFSVLSGQGGQRSPSNPLYQFSISADPAGTIEWTKVVLTLGKTPEVALKNVYLADDATGARVLDGNAVVNGNTITIDSTTNTNLGQYQQVAAGTTKIYDLYGTVNGFTAGSSLMIGLLSDIVHVSNASAQQVSGNVVWSDRSTSPHSIESNDWTNGDLLKNFTNSTVLYGGDTYPTACTLSASPQNVSPGQSTVISWQTQGATSFAIDQGVGVVMPTASGSVAVTPTGTTTYTGTATGSMGSVAHCQVIVYAPTAGPGT